MKKTILATSLIVLENILERVSSMVEDVSMSEEEELAVDDYVRDGLMDFVRKTENELVRLERERQ